MQSIDKVVINAIIYIIVTAFFGYLLINEKKLGEKVKGYRDKFSDMIILKKKLVLDKDNVKNLYYVHIALLIAGMIMAAYFMVYPSDMSNFVKYMALIFANLINMLLMILIIVTVFMYVMVSLKKAEFDVLKNMGPICFLAIVGVMIYNHLMIQNAPKFTLVDVFLFLNLLLFAAYIFSGEGSIRKFVDYTEMLVSAIVLVLMIQHFYVGNFLVPTGSMIPTIQPGDRLLGDMVSYKFIKPSRGDIVVFKEPYEDKVLYTKRLIGYPGERVKVGEDGKIYVNGKMVENKKITAKYYRKGFMADKEWVIPKKGDTIEVIGGHAVLPDEKVQDINIEELQQLMAMNDKKVTDSIFYLRFLLNGKDEIGPIMDFKYNKEIAEKLFKGEKVTLDKDYYFVLGDNSDNSFDSRFWGFVSEDRIKGRPFMRFFPIKRIGLLK